MLKLYVFDRTNGVSVEADLSKISDFVAASGTVVWIDALDPSAEEMSLLACEFGLHPLAVEDYNTPHSRPKVDEFPGCYFIVVHVLGFDAQDEDLKTAELSIFVGSNYIVTAHKNRVPLLDRTGKLWRNDPGLVADGAGMLLYDIVDGLLDSYFPILDQMEDQLDELEDAIFQSNGVSSAERIFKLKRSLLVFRRITAPMRDVLNVLIRRDQPLFNEKVITYLRDVYDHTLRVTDTVDTYRDILSGAMDAYLSVVSNQLNLVMKKLTVVATILISLQVISGLYGMNFKYMPELYWRYGYVYVLGLMAAVSAALFYYFKRIKWL